MVIPQTFYLYTQTLYFAAIIVRLCVGWEWEFGRCGMMKTKLYNRSRRTKVVQICQASHESRCTSLK
jgi:hypothetical protein